MAGSFGKRHCKELLNHTFGKTPDNTPAGVIYVSLHTGDPGEDGQTANEATGSGYARVATAATDWVAATDATPSVTKNANQINFPTATGDWSSGSNMTYAALWNHATSNAESNYIGSCQLSVAKPVINTDMPFIAANALQMSMS